MQLWREDRADESEGRISLSCVSCFTYTALTVTAIAGFFQALERLEVCVGAAKEQAAKQESP
jgi:hypothetical protein